MQANQLKTSAKTLFLRLCSSTPVFICLLISVSRSQLMCPLWLEILAVQLCLFSSVFSFIYVGWISNIALIVIRTILVAVFVSNSDGVGYVFAVILELFLQRETESISLHPDYMANLRTALYALITSFVLGFLFLHRWFFIIPVVVLAFAGTFAFRFPDPNSRRPLEELFNPIHDLFRTTLYSLAGAVGSLASIVLPSLILGASYQYLWIGLTTAFAWFLFLPNLLRSSQAIKVRECLLPVLVLGFTLIGISLEAIPPLDHESYSLVFNLCITAVSGVAVFNITSLFVVVQINFQKFGSMRVLTDVLVRPLVLLCATGPFFVLGLLFFLSLVSPCTPVVLAILLYLSVSSSLGLFILFSTSLEIVSVVNNVLRRVTMDDVYDDNLATVSLFETRIESATIVCTTVMVGADRFTVNKMIPLLVIFFKKMGLSKLSTANYRERRINKLLHFTYEIQDALVTTKSPLLVETLRDCFRNYLMTDLSIENLGERTFIYSFLAGLMKKFLEKDDDLADSLLAGYFHRIDVLFLSINESDSGDDPLFTKSRNLKLFNETVLEPIVKVVRFAIENDADNFLRRMDLVRSLFSSENQYDLRHHTHKIRFLLLHHRHIINEKNVFLLGKGALSLSLEYDYEVLFPLENHRFSNGLLAFKKYRSLYSSYFMDFFLAAIQEHRSQSRKAIKILHKMIRTATLDGDVEMFFLVAGFLSVGLDHFRQFHCIAATSEEGITDFWIPFLEIPRNLGGTPNAKKKILRKTWRLCERLKSKYPILVGRTLPKYNFNHVEMMIPEKFFRIQN